MTETNQPPFDPLHPTSEEADDMYHGYLEGSGSGRPDASLAYAHGRACRINDNAGIVEPWQIALAERRRRERLS